MYTVGRAKSTRRYWDGTKFRVLYQFKCERCGADIWKRTGQLATMTGFCRPCASARPNHHTRKRPHEWRFNLLVRGARPREVEVGLSYEEYLSFTTESQCHYCDDEIDWSPYNKHRKGHVGCNLDRKDNAKGYTLENCVVCCGFCNRIKNNHLSYEEMLRLSPVLREIRAARKETR
jgi:hypothetical protein